MVVAIASSGCLTPAARTASSTEGDAVRQVIDAFYSAAQRREFRFDLRYRALTGTSRSGLVRQIEQGFGNALVFHIPSTTREHIGQ